MLPGAVLDRAHAILDRGVLLAHAGDAGEGRGLLRLAVDQVVVTEVAQRHVVVVDFGMHVEATVELGALGIAEWTLGLPAVGVDPAPMVVDRPPPLALIDLAGSARR